MRKASLLPPNPIHQFLHHLWHLHLYKFKLVKAQRNFCLEKREWEVRNVRNWLDDGEEFFRDYNDLSPPPRNGPQLRESKPIQHPPLRRPFYITTTNPKRSKPKLCGYHIFVIIANFIKLAICNMPKV